MKRTLQLLAIGLMSAFAVRVHAQAGGPHEPMLSTPPPIVEGAEVPDPADAFSNDLDMLGDDDFGMPPPPLQHEMPPPPPGPGMQPPPPGEMQRPDRKPDPKKLEELKQKILELKYDRMKKAVAMDDETWAKFFKVYKPAETDIEAIVKERNEEMKKLGRLMQGAGSDADVDPEMEKIRTLNRKIEDRVAKLNEDLKPVLSSRQRARLLVFEHEFNGRIRDEVRKQRNMSPEERRDRQQKLREWWMKNHPKRPEQPTRPESK